ncbi:MAG: ECF transporter S component [Clostridium sp.]
MGNRSIGKISGKEVAFYGLFIALVYVATRFINIPGPTAGGLFHLGNVMFFTIAMVFGKRAGAISGGVGMALFDLTSPYVIWAPFTLIIRFVMGYIIGHFANSKTDVKFKKSLFTGIGLLSACVVMLVGYYFTEVLLYSNWILPLQSLWNNFMQCVVGTVISVPLAASLKLGFKNRKIPTEI